MTLTKQHTLLGGSAAVIGFAGVDDRTISSSSFSIFWLTPQRFDIESLHRLWQFTWHSEQVHTTHQVVNTNSVFLEMGKVKTSGQTRLLQTGSENLPWNFKILVLQDFLNDRQVRGETSSFLTMFNITFWANLLQRRSESSPPQKKSSMTVCNILDTNYNYIHQAVKGMLIYFCSRTKETFTKSPIIFTPK